MLKSKHSQELGFGNICFKKHMAENRLMPLFEMKKIEPKIYIVEALEDMNTMIEATEDTNIIVGHRWLKGNTYIVKEWPSWFHLEAEDGAVAYLSSVKDQVFENFRIIEDTEAEK